MLCQDTQFDSLMLGEPTAHCRCCRWEQMADLAERYHNGSDNLIGACLNPIGTSSVLGAVCAGLRGGAAARSTGAGWQR